VKVTAGVQEKLIVPTTGVIQLKDLGPIAPAAGAV